jgi:hypothetical protein
VPRGDSLRPAAEGALRAVRARPSFAFYLIAILLLPVKWLSPLPYERAGLSDAFVALAAAAWTLEAVRTRKLPRPRAVHYALGAYVLLTFASALAASDRTSGLTNALIVAELVTLFLLTSEYASHTEARDAIVLAFLCVTGTIVVETVLTLALFYAGVHTSLEGIYGVDLTPSDLYTRVAAGFYSAPLLGSFCIAGAAILANDESAVPRSLRRAGMVALSVVVVLTISRAVIGFVVAAGLWLGNVRGTRAARIAGVTVACAGVAFIATITVGRLRLQPADPTATRYVLLNRHDNPRLDGATESFKTLWHKPALGKGPGTLTGESEGQPFRAHLTPLYVAATTGLPALASLATAVILMWRRRRRPTDVATWSGLAGLGVDGLAQDIDHFRHVWILLGLADAGRARSQDRVDVVEDQAAGALRP